MIARAEAEDAAAGEPALIRAHTCRPCGGSGLVIARRWFRTRKIVTCGKCDGLGHVYQGLPS